MVTNHYGPTETTVGCLFFSQAARVDDYKELVASAPVGRPIANMKAYVLNECYAPVPIGVPGQLYIGGIGVGRGYLNQPDLTAYSYVPDPFTPDGGRRMYGSGDMVRWLSNGCIEFLRRCDHQVKIRGFRVELQEIEAVLSQHSSVNKAVIAIQGQRQEARRLVAYVVPKRGHSLSADEMRKFMLGRLPEYMVPNDLVLLEHIPLTPTGKVDRVQLPQPDRTRPGPESNFEPPATATQEAIVRLWSILLGVERIGIHDSFFELGGHSLLATQLISRMRDEFHVELRLRHLFDKPTVAGLAETIEMVNWMARNTEAVRYSQEGEREEGTL